MMCSKEETKLKQQKKNCRKIEVKWKNPQKS